MSGSHRTERVQREQASFDDGGIKAAQRKLSAALDHVNNGPSARRREDVVRRFAGQFVDGRILEIGSRGWTSVFPQEGRQPKDVTCINISNAELDIGRRLAEKSGFRAQFRLMDAHALEFPDNSFDLVFGLAILHHLEFARALEEIQRVLKPGGGIMFIEPLRLNPVAQLVRFMTPRARTVDERPLGPAELRLVGRYFEMSSLYSDLFTVPAGFASRYLFRDPSNLLTRSAEACDRALLAAMPACGAIYRIVTLMGHKRVQPH